MNQAMTALQMVMQRCSDSSSEANQLYRWKIHAPQQRRIALGKFLPVFLCAQ